MEMDLADIEMAEQRPKAAGLVMIVVINGEHRREERESTSL